MNKKIIKYFIIGILIVFLILFFFGSSIFKNKLTEKKDLTLEQIEKFEDDIKNGVEIDLNDYVVKDKSYDNSITNINRKISNIIEFGFKKVFEYLLKNIEV